MICLRIGKISKTKTPLGDFKIATPKNPLLSQQVVTSKGMPVPYINLQLNLYLNTQSDLFCCDNLSFLMHGSQYVTNQLMHKFKYVTNHQLEKDVSCKVLQFINTMKITKLLDYKTLRHTNAAVSSRERWTIANLSPVTICLNKTFTSSFIHLHQLWWPLK